MCIKQYSIHIGLLDLSKIHKLQIFNPDGIFKE